MKMKSLVLAALLLGTLAACRKGNGNDDHKRAVYDSTPSPFMQKTVVELDEYHKQNAWLQVPVHYNSGFDTERYPLVIFFNGKFEGSDYGGLEKMVKVGLPALMADSLRFTFDVAGKNHQMIVLCPQSSNGHTSPAAVNQTIEYMLANYRIDASRIYLTGVSSGAATVFSYLTGSPENAARIAAAVPMSSIELETEKIQNLKFISNAGTPVKIFCGTNDNLLEKNKNYAEQINKYKPGLAVFTSYSGGHGSWNPIYNPTHKFYNPNIYEWMLQYHK